MLNRMKVAGLLSFGPDGIDLPLEPLNVLIGPNGSGKTNFLEALGLLKAAPRDVLKPLTQWGGLRDWLWKGKSAPTSTSLEATVAYPPGENLRHMLSLGQMNGRLAVTNERIEPIGTCTNERAALSYFRPPRDEKTESYLRQLSPNSLDPNSSGSLLAHFLDDGIHFRSDYLPEVSLVSLANPHDYPALWHLKTHYESIHLYRDWSFGPLAGLRKPASAHDRADFLNESGANLAPVLSNFPGKTKRQLIAALQKLYDGVVDVKTPVVGGTVHGVLGGGRQPGDSRDPTVGRHTALPVPHGNPATPESTASGRHRRARAGPPSGPTTDVDRFPDFGL